MNKNTNKLKCDVSNCAYHNENNRCDADCVCIGPSRAITSSDTICSTFKSHSSI